MAAHKFTWWINDDWEGADPGEDTIDELAEKAGLPRDLARRLLAEKPFYEVTLQCEVDDETLEVTILSAACDRDG